MNRKYFVAYLVRSRASELFRRIAMQEFPKKAEPVAWQQYAKLRELADRIEAA